MQSVDERTAVHFRKPAPYCFQPIKLVKYTYKQDTKHLDQ